GVDGRVGRHVDLRRDREVDLGVRRRRAHRPEGRLSRRDDVEGQGDVPDTGDVDLGLRDGDGVGAVDHEGGGGEHLQHVHLGVGGGLLAACLHLDEVAEPDHGGGGDARGQGVEHVHGGGVIPVVEGGGRGQHQVLGAHRRVQQV